MDRRYNIRLPKIRWITDLRDECAEAHVSFFYKQFGGRSKIDGAWGGRLLEGQTYDEMPKKHMVPR